MTTYVKGMSEPDKGVQVAIRSLYLLVKEGLGEDLGNERLSDIEDNAREAAIDLIVRKGYGPDDTDLLGTSVAETVQTALQVAFMLMLDMEGEEHISPVAPESDVTPVRTKADNRLVQFKQGDRVQMFQEGQTYTGVVESRSPCDNGQHLDFCHIVRISWDTSYVQAFHTETGLIEPASDKQD